MSETAIATAGVVGPCGAAEDTEPIDALEAAGLLLGEEMARFETSLGEALEEQAVYLSETERELYRRGKKLRPILMLASAKLTGPPDPGGEPRRIPDKAIKASVSLEMLHVATLIHDDIVDDSATRRGVTSVHAARGTEVAVLVGDLQFIQAIRCFANAVETEHDMKIVRMILDLGFNICCGELDELQTDPVAPLSVLLSRYDRTIDRKTAQAFGLSCEIGASLMGAGTRATFFVSRFGRCFGRAFQIMDDLLDLVRPQSVSGKPRGVDLARGRLSLPVILASEELPHDHVLHRLMVEGESELGDGELEKIVDDVAASKAFLETYSRARDAMLEALHYLHLFPDGPYRQALERIAWMVIDRRVEASAH